MSELLPPPANPMAVARELLTDWTDQGASTLLAWRGGWMQWTGSCWAEIEEAELRSSLYKRLESAMYTDAKGELKEWAPNRRKVADLVSAIAGIVHLTERTDPPSWLTRFTESPAGEIVACKNGLLHVGTRELLDHAPTFFNTVAVPFDYDPAAPSPARWLDFLGQLWPNDLEAIAALQEYFGYVLSGRTDLQKILLMVGPSRSGKGTIARVLTALVGRGNVAGPTLASLGTNFGLSPLLGKSLATISDARLGGANVHQVVERLLSISGEDFLTVDRKFKEPWTGKLSTRFVLLSNELPRFGDASGAIANRFIALMMTESFLGRENPKLTGELLAELPGVLRWALDGLDHLRDGSFTVPKSSRDATTMLQDLVSPVAAFVREKCERGPHEIAVATLFAAWKEWCEDNGHKPGSVQTFGRDLRAVVPQLRSIRPRTGADRERRYAGIKLLPEEPTHNGADCGPPRTAPPNTALVRGGPRTGLLQPHHCTGRWQDCDNGNCHTFGACVVGDQTTNESHIT